MHKINGPFPIHLEIFCIVFFQKKFYLSSAKEKVDRKREILMIREQEEKIREEVDSEEEWRAIITSTDNGKKEKMG